MHARADRSGSGVAWAATPSLRSFPCCCSFPTSSTISPRCGTRDARRGTTRLSIRSLSIGTREAAVVTQFSPAVASPGPAWYPPNWYPDPWRIAPWRWWDGAQWTPVIYGPYGEAWPIGYQPQMPFVPKGPGIKGGGIAGVGIGLGFVGSTAVIIGFVVSNGGRLDSNNPWYLLWSQLALWV